MKFKKTICLIICSVMIFTIIPYSAFANTTEKCPSEKYVDVPGESVWSHAGIDYCIEKGYMTGTDGTHFSPKASCTRAMIVTVLYSIAGKPYVTYKNTFSDVQNGKWYSKAVTWANENGIISGYGTGKFGTNDAITREALVTMLKKSAEVQYTLDTSKSFDITSFIDCDDSTWSQNAMSWAVGEGILSGVGINGISYLKPKQKASREQVALILMKYSENVLSKRFKKYFTISFDDGITQDKEIIKIFKRYGFTGGTFNINTGLYGVNWQWVGEACGKVGLSHLRFTEAELKTGIYDGFDVEVHTLHHPSLKAYDNNPETLISEVRDDADNIYGITGIKPVGMAWPGGESECTDTTIDIILKNTDIRFARGINPTYSFKLPDYFMIWRPTCSISDSSVLTLARQFIDSKCEEDMLFYVWGHGYELDLYDSYDVLEELIQMITDADNIEIVTNAEFYNLYKDEIPSWK